MIQKPSKGLADINWADCRRYYDGLNWALKRYNLELISLKYHWHENVSFQMELVLKNLEQYNSQYDLKTEGRSNSNLLDRFH